HLIDAAIPTEHRQGMGGTIILWQALRGAQIDAYPEYTGTIAQEILKSDRALTLDEIRESLAKFGVGMTASLGFSNTYALVMRRSDAQRLGIRTISDLRKYPKLKLGLTHEFLERQDGWRPLRERYDATRGRNAGRKTHDSPERGSGAHKRLRQSSKPLFQCGSGLSAAIVGALRPLPLWRILSSQARALDASPSPVSWIFPAAFGVSWDSARYRR